MLCYVLAYFICHARISQITYLWYWSILYDVISYYLILHEVVFCNIFYFYLGMAAGTGTQLSPLPTRTPRADRSGNAGDIPRSPRRDKSETSARSDARR